MLIDRGLVASIVLGFTATAVLAQPASSPSGGGRGPMAPQAGGPAGLGAPPGGPGRPGRSPAGQESADAPPAPTGGPIRVTTDTPEFCDTLANRVARAERARPDVPRQAEELAEEGHQMCSTGLIRGGLVRLRRALLMLLPDQ